MKGRRENPDFIVDQSGNIQDVRHKKHLHEQRPLKFEKISPQDEEGGPKRSSLSENLGCLLSFLGGLLFVGGIALVIGNMSGKFPTFPFAGFITMSIGGALMAVGLKKG